MKFFIDTANLEMIQEAQDLGILDGVTTNPSLMAKEGISGNENIINHYKTFKLACLYYYLKSYHFLLVVIFLIFIAIDEIIHRSLRRCHHPKRTIQSISNNL